MAFIKLDVKQRLRYY